MSNILASLTDLFREARTWAWLLLPTALVLSYYAFTYTNIGLLQIHSIDEYVFHGSVRYMLESLLSGKLSGLFGYGFYQYGFVYFFIHLVAITPFIEAEQTWLAIAIPRLITSLFALLSVLAVYQLTRLYIEKIPALLFSTLLITMPAFWYNATWFHPDWVMTFWLLLCVYFLAKDDFTYRHNFWLGVVSFALAVTFKYQAITAIPLIAMYVFYDQLRGYELRNLITPLKHFVGSLTTIIIVFILGNPYIIHPMGWIAFSGAFVGNMKSNATNHGLVDEATIFDKVHFAIGDNFLNIIFFFILNLGALWLVYRYFAHSKRNFFSVLAINYLVNVGYLLWFVNKAWQTYYLPVIMVGVVLLVYYIPFIVSQWRSYTLAGVILAQLCIYGASYHNIFTTPRDHAAPDYITYDTKTQAELNTFIVETLRPLITPTTNVLLSPYTPFTYEDLGLRYEQVRTIFGALGKANFTSDEYLVGQRAYWGDLKSDEELLKSFKPIDFIVIRKDIPYINTALLANVRDKDVHKAAAQIVKELYDGVYPYTVLAENDNVVIFISTSH